MVNLFPYDLVLSPMIDPSMPIIWAAKHYPRSSLLLALLIIAFFSAVALGKLIRKRG